MVLAKLYIRLIIFILDISNMDREILEVYISRIQRKGLMNPFTLDSGRKINKIQIIIKKKVLINKVYLQLKGVLYWRIQIGSIRWSS